MKKLFLFILLFIPAIVFAELVKTTVVDKMEVLENGTVQVRQAIRVVEDGKVISQQFHRYVVLPGEDYSKREAKVKAVCETVQTQAVIDAFKNPTTPEVVPGLVKQTKVSKIHILEDGTVVAEKKTEVLDSGKVIGSSVQREKIVSGTDFMTKDAAIVDVCTVVQTKEVVDAYVAKYPVAEVVTK